HTRLQGDWSSDVCSSDLIVSPGGGDKAAEGRNELCRVRCALPDIRVVEWHLHGSHLDLPFHHQDRGVDSFFVIEGVLEAVLGKRSEERRVGKECRSLWWW